MKIKKRKNKINVYTKARELADKLKAKENKLDTMSANWQQEPFHEGPFSVIVADCPWAYNNYRDSANGAASSAMTVMQAEDIAAIPVDKWAAKNSLLVMWATFPRILEVFRIASAWGFLEKNWYELGFNSKQYKSGFPWVKTVPSTGNISTGIGHWTQGTSELVFLFTRGKLKKKAGRAVKGLVHGEKGQAIFYCPKGGKHSDKPEELQTWLERIINGSRLELFSRRPKPGWQTWGLDTGFELSKDGVAALYPQSMDCLPDTYVPW